MTPQPFAQRTASTLRLERRMLLARYDSGALPPGIAQLLRRLETEIAEIERGQQTQNGPTAISRA